MRAGRRLLAIWFGAALIVGGHAVAQVPARQPDTAPPASVQPAPAPEDSLGRESPFGTVTGFTRAAHRDDLVVATRYLQVGKKSASESEQLARDLNDLIGRYFTRPLTSLSNSPNGDLDDGLAPDRDRLTLDMGEKQVDIFLNRVKDPAGQMIWLFASDSLAKVPALVRSRQATFAERVMPREFVAREYLGISLAQWVLWAASLVVPLLFLWAAAWVVHLCAMRLVRNTARKAVFARWWQHTRWLVVIELTLVVHLLVVRWLGFSLTFRYNYERIGLIAVVIVGAVLIWRLVTIVLGQARLLAIQHDRADTRSLILLGERVIKAVVILVMVFIVLGLAGFDLTTALAGVGLAGVAVALGAQKSVENLLGAIFLLTDKALAVGDYCRVADREGWIEDVTLRSVRLRTLQQTLVSIPAGVLSQGNIENFTSRRKILMQNTLRLRYDTTVEQLQRVLEGVRQVLLRHPNIEPESARVRLVNLGAQAVELEVFAYVTTADGLKFLEIREDILLQAAAVVESSGSAFAAPTQMVYLGHDADPPAGRPPTPAPH